MNSATSRTLGLALMGVSVVVWAWSFDLSEQNASLRLSLAQTRLQTERLAQVASPQAADTRHRYADLKESEAKRWRSAAAGYGSDAQNLAAALGRVKVWCASSGLAECQVTKSNVAGTGAQVPALAAVGATAAASAASTGIAFSSSAVRLTATFSAEATRRLLKLATECACLFRLERFSVQQNRLEMDIVFFHNRDEVRPASLPGVPGPSPAMRPSS